MFKRSSANYSLWPEQARPRRGMRLSLAAGGFAVGIVCAIAAVNVASQFVRPMAMEVEPVQDVEAIRPIPVYSGASKLVADKPAASADEQPTPHSRPRAVAKVALPTIGRAVPVMSETDGSGDNSVRMPPVRLTDTAGVQAATVASNPKLAAPAETPGSPADETTLASREPAPEAAVQPTTPEPAAVRQHATRPQIRQRSRTRAERRAVRRRSSPSYSRYAREPRRSRQRSHQPSYAARYRAGPVYGANGARISGSFSN